jgi:hypothetical protein
MKFEMPKFERHSILRGIIWLSLSFLPEIVNSDIALASTNWCTSSPDTIIIGDGRARQDIDFSSACRGHDICYFTIGADKAQCDTAFRSDLGEICRQAFESNIPLQGQCNLNADLYYNAVSGSGIVGTATGGIANRSYIDAQNEAFMVGARLVERFPGLDIEQYYQEIASQLASRQANGESVDESIDNAINTIAASIIASNGIEGQWVGQYTCGQGRTGVTLTINQEETEITAEFALYPLRENPSVPSGVALFRGTFNPNTLEMSLQGVRWLQSPGSNWVIVDFSGRFDPELRSFAGRKHSPDCGSITLVRAGS